MPNQEVQSLQDFYSFLTILIAVCAILSPVITTLVNNHHQKVMKQLEYERSERAEEVLHIREIYEGYVREAGACLYIRTEEQVTKYGKYFGLILYYVPNVLRMKIIELDNVLLGDEPSDIPVNEQLEDIAIRLHQLSKDSQ